MGTKTQDIKNGVPETLNEIKDKLEDARILMAQLLTRKDIATEVHGNIEDAIRKSGQARDWIDNAIDNNKDD